MTHASRHPPLFFEVAMQALSEGSVAPSALLRLTAPTDEIWPSTARFGVVWDAHKNGYRALTVEQEPGLAAAADGTREYAWVHPDSLDGHRDSVQGYHSGLESMRFASRQQNGRWLVTLESSPGSKPSMKGALLPVSTWAMDGASGELFLPEGLQLYTNPAGWVGLAPPGAYTNTDPARRQWTMVASGGASYMFLPDGRQLYVNPSGRVCTELPGRCTNTEDARRLWTFRDAQGNPQVRPIREAALMLGDGRQVYMDTKGWARVGFPADLYDAAGHEQAQMYNVVQPRHLCWKPEEHKILGPHLELLRFNHRTLRCDDGCDYRVVTLEELPGALIWERMRATAPDHVPLRVMSFNIWVNGGYSIQRTIAAIAAVDADIVCLQESSPAMTRLCGTALGLFFSGRNAILSRLPIQVWCGTGSLCGRLWGAGEDRPLCLCRHVCLSALIVPCLATPRDRNPGVLVPILPGLMVVGRSRSQWGVGGGALIRDPWLHGEGHRLECISGPQTTCWRWGSVTATELIWVPGICCPSNTSEPGLCLVKVCTPQGSGLPALFGVVGTPFRWGLPPPPGWVGVKVGEGSVGQGIRAVRLVFFTCERSPRPGPSGPVSNGQPPPVNRQPKSCCGAGVPRVWGKYFVSARLEMSPSLLAGAAVVCLLGRRCACAWSFRQWTRLCDHHIGQACP